METKTALEIRVLKVLEVLKVANYSLSTISVYRIAYKRLLKKAAEMQIDTLSDELVEYFMNDSTNSRTGAFCYSRKCLHISCIRKLGECEEKGYVGWKPCVESKIAKPASIDFQDLHINFMEYLETERKSKNTIDSYRNISCKFLLFIERIGHTSLREVPLASIYEFFIDLKGTWNTGSLRTAAAGLRSFLSFAEEENKLLAVVPEKLLRKRSIIPVLTQEEELAVWAVLRTDAVSSRDKAIILLLLLTGLRAVDIVNLKLSDIDWKCDIISINQKKTSQPLVLPLLPAIGNAIATYITNDRPQSNSPHVFLRYSAPHTPIKDHAGCYSVVRHIFTLAEIRLETDEIKGTRLLRHHMASKMLKNGVPVQTISLVLGHTNPNSTDIYLTTDDEKMRECALPLSVIPMKVGGLR